MDYIDILQEMLQYIDKHIKEKLSVEKLAARAGFSTYHFCRIFQWGVGYSIMEYVRKRRLAFAASELTSGKKLSTLHLNTDLKHIQDLQKRLRMIQVLLPPFKEHGNIYFQNGFQIQVTNLWKMELILKSTMIAALMKKERFVIFTYLL